MSMHDAGIMDKEDENAPAPLYTFREFYIAERMMPGIRRYIEKGIKPGRFLCAVIQNDLHDALSFAGDENLKNLAAFTGYFYNEAPGGCWGSRENMAAWMKRFEDKDDEGTASH